MTQLAKLIAGLARGVHHRSMVVFLFILIAFRVAACIVAADFVLQTSCL